MSYQAFTQGWAQEWKNKINQNERYKEAARDWTSPLIIAVKGDSEIGIDQNQSVYVDLKNGQCLDARIATDDDLHNATFIISADIKTWKKILTGETDVTIGIMMGKLKLVKGNVGELAQYVTAAKQLVASAAQIETIFSEEN